MYSNSLSGRLLTVRAIRGTRGLLGWEGSGRARCSERNLLCSMFHGAFPIGKQNTPAPVKMSSDSNVRQISTSDYSRTCIVAQGSIVVANLQGYHLLGQFRRQCRFLRYDKQEVCRPVNSKIGRNHPIRHNYC